MQGLSGLLINCLGQGDETVSAQALDTCFDLFCNEDYDDIFRGAGLMHILEQGLAYLRGREKDEFLRQVAVDL